MAVTIDELNVEVKDPAPVSSAAASSPGAEPKVDFRLALAMVHERELRLKAD